MKHFEFDGLKLAVPESWRECTRSQISAALPLQLSLQESGNDATAAFHYLLQLSEALTGANLSALTQADRMQIYTAINWAVTSRINFKPFDFFELEGTKYYLPEEGFYNTSAFELSMANIWYLLYTNPENPQWKAVYHLIATICRPRRLNYLIRKIKPNYNGDDRVILNTVKTDKAAAAFEQSLPLGMVMAILQYWESMNNQFIEQNKDLFDGSIGGRALFKNGEGWIAMLEDVAREGVHGDFEKVSDTNCHTIFMYMKHRKAVFDEQARQAEKDD